MESTTMTTAMKYDNDEEEQDDDNDNKNADDDDDAGTPVAIQPWLGVLCKGPNPVIEAFFNLWRRNFYDGVDNNHDDFSCE